MESLKIVVVNSTGSEKLPAEMYLVSGVIKFEGSPAVFSSIEHEKRMGKSILEHIEEALKRPEVVTALRSGEDKKKKKKG